MTTNKETTITNNQITMTRMKARIEMVQKLGERTGIVHGIAVHRTQSMELKAANR
jgi:hypothetical protein